MIGGVFLCVKENFPFQHIHNVPNELYLHIVCTKRCRGVCKAMNYKLLKYYKENLSVEALVESHMKKVSFTLNIIFWINIFSLLLSLITGLIFYFLHINEPFYITISTFLISFFGLLISMRMYVRRAKEIVRRTLGITSYGEKWRWRTEEFNNYQRELFVDFLTNNNMMKKWKIEKVIDSIKNEDEKNKVPSFIAPTVFFTLTVPNLNQFFAYIYEANESKVITVFIYIFVGTTLLVIFINRINEVAQKVREYFLGDFQHKDNLINLLEEALYTLDE